ncbi:MAG: hypothetical protein PHR52_08845 [Fermentimonas sp.]|nr:hypothetical protein [Fermentimonas sp.]
MKKNIIIPILLSLFIFVGCVEDLPQASLVEIEQGSTYLSLRSSQITVPDDGADIESITLNSLRILVFNKATGLIVTNKKFDITSVNATEQLDGSWVADFSDFVATTNPGLSVVYAVLNEDVTEVSGQSLTSALENVTALAGMQTLVNTPLTYIPLRVVFDEDTGKPIEPPFVMVAYDEFTIPDGRPLTDPFVADLRGLGGESKGFAMDRTMAKVRISKVTSEPYDVSQVTDNVATSYIHILQMGLVNVPKSYLWSPPDNLVPYGGVYQNFTFNLPVTTPQINYYGRDWGGSISAATGTINVVWRQYGRSDKRIYRVFASSGSNMYGLTFNPDVTFDNATPAGNEGNFPKYLIEYFKTGNAGEAYTGDLDIPEQNLNFTVTGAPWTLKEKNISYYIPENIIGESTKLHVKAAIASIDFDPTVKFTEDQVTWVKKGGEIEWIYPPDDAVFANIVTNAFRFISQKHVTYNEATKVVVFDESKINVLDGPPYYHFWDATFFWREARGTVSVSEADLGFADPSKNSTNIRDFYIPIQNTGEDGKPNGDYNIYRNNEYKFSVHVLKQWETAAPQGAPIPQASTRSASDDPNESMVLRIVPE